MPTKDVGRWPDSGHLPNLTPAISPTSANKTFSLTPAERIHLDIYGYVVLEKLLSKAEVDLLVETIFQFEKDYHRDKVPHKSHMFFTSTTWDFFRIDNLPHLAGCFRNYVTNPKITAKSSLRSKYIGAGGLGDTQNTIAKSSLRSESNGFGGLGDS